LAEILRNTSAVNYFFSLSKGLCRTIKIEPDSLGLGMIRKLGKILRRAERSPE